METIDNVLAWCGAAGFWLLCSWALWWANREPYHRFTLTDRLLIAAGPLTLVIGLCLALIDLFKHRRRKPRQKRAYTVKRDSHGRLRLRATTDYSYPLAAARSV